MKLDLFDDMDGLILHERENSMGAMEMKVNITNKGQDNCIPFPCKNSPCHGLCALSAMGRDLRRR